MTRNKMRLFSIFLVFFFSTGLLFSKTNTLQKVEVLKGELRLHFTGIISKYQVKHFTLDSPQREVLDFKNTVLSFARIVKKSKGYTYKIAQYTPTIVRIVIESHKPYSCMPYKPILTKRAYHIPLPKGTYNVTFKTYQKKVLDKAKKKIIKKYKPKVQAKKLQRSHRYDRVVIDAGHGGHDSGAVGGKKKEKDLVLQISKRLAQALRKQGYSVYMTRKRDKFIKLEKRTKLADIYKASVFISIHANSVPKKKRYKIQGIETFFLQTTRDAKSQRIAARENKALLKGASSKLSKSVIIDSVLTGPKIVQSNKLAIDVHSRMITNLRKHYKGVRDGGVRHAPFWVLVGASRPSILVEVGYISHPKERQRLFSSRYQKLIVKGITEGIDNYLNNRKKEIDF